MPGEFLYTLLCSLNRSAYKKFIANGNSDTGNTRNVASDTD